jgi:broad specificity phosphatase PhoE
LHEDAAIDIAALRSSGVLPDRAAWFSSDEPKAVQTATRLGGSPRLLRGLREVERPADWLSSEEFAAVVTRSMQQPAVPGRPGWESAAAVQARVYDTLLRHVFPVVQTQPAESSTDIVLVGHGTAWTMLVAALTDQPPDVEAWRGMTTPDHCALELERGSVQDGTDRPTRANVVRRWGGWRST